MKKHLTSFIAFIKAMSYPELLSHLYNSCQRKINYNLETMQILDRHLGSPSRSFRSIHVGGTNGKGSVTTKIASALSLSGFKVGKYTSPHISSFRERIQVNDSLIDEKSVEELLPQVLLAIEATGQKASFFEITTCLAFLYFKKQKIDFAVIEVGLGGRLDATNIISPMLSIVTSIDSDHTSILGHSLEDIAKEKAGIIKKNIPVLIGPDVKPKCIFKDAAAKNDCLLFEINERKENFELENQLIARRALEILGLPFVEQGMKKVPVCRYEVFYSPKKIILDVAHNPHGLKALFERVCKEEKEFDVLFGLSADKDMKECLKIITHLSHELFVTQAPMPRAASITTIAQLLEELNCHKYRCFESPEFALEKALQNKRPLVICGSFFIMASIRKALGVKEPCDPLLLGEALLQK